jgi:hypothetical protein
VLLGGFGLAGGAPAAPEAAAPASRIETTRDRPPAAGGEALFSAALRHPLTLVGRVGKPVAIDSEGYGATLEVERVLQGTLDTGTALRIGWEELSPRRRVRFVDGQQVLLTLAPLPNGSLWSRRFPTREAWAVASGGDAFLRDPSPASVETLARYLALPDAERQQAAGVAALAAMARQAELPLAQAAIQTLRQVRRLAQVVDGTAHTDLSALLLDAERPESLRRQTVELVGAQGLDSLAPALERLVSKSASLAPAALLALAELQDGLPEERVGALLESQDPELRAVAVRTAGAELTASRLAAIAFSDRAPQVRAAAVQVSLTRGGLTATDVGVTGLFDEDQQVRQVAMQSLAALGDAVVPAIRARVERQGNEEPGQLLAPLATLSMTGPEGKAALVGIADSHPEERVRAFASFLLGRNPAAH